MTAPVASTRPASTPANDCSVVIPIAGLRVARTVEAIVGASRAFRA